MDNLSDAELESVVQLQFAMIAKTLVEISKRRGGEFILEIGRSVGGCQVSAEIKVCKSDLGASREH